MMDTFGTHQANGIILRALYQPPAANATANAIAAAAAALLAQQTQAIDALIADANSPVVVHPGPREHLCVGVGVCAYVSARAFVRP